MARGTLTLSDGTVLEGEFFGHKKSVAGEVVFNTGMVGYPESMTDPSYTGQILVFTYPLIGNYGVPDETIESGMLKYFESDKISVKGIIVTENSKKFSHWNSKKTLEDWMKEKGIPGLCAIDTRHLTKKLRTKGVMLGKIEDDEKIAFDDPNIKNLVQTVSTKKTVVYNPGKNITVVVVDCGAKNNIIRSLIKRDITVKKVPWDYPFHTISCDGILISNGPGDPKQCVKTVESTKKTMEKGIPIFGICLGNQILALAAGANTYKLKFGHRSQNQPAIDLTTNRCYITSQNHGFAVDEKTLPKSWKPWFRNGNDKTNEGIMHKSKPWYSVQFHPEATPGPTDTAWLFDKFIADIKRRK